MLSLKVDWLNRRNTEYTTSIMADSARVPERIAWKRDQKGQSIAPRPSSFAVASTLNVSNPTFLAENDIPGASLLGRKPEELKISELKFWLKCRGDAGTRLKTKAERSAWLHTTLVSGQNWGRNCFLFTFEHFIKFAHAKLFNWNCLANNNSDYEVLRTATSGWPWNLQFSCKSYFVITSLFFSTELVIPCFYIQIFLIVVNLLVDWELIPYMNKFLLFCSFNLLWVESFPTSLIFNLLCFKVC